jgi:hypothetical protein
VRQTRELYSVKVLTALFAARSIDGVIKLTDFGVSKKIADVISSATGQKKMRNQATNLQTMIGTPFWMVKSQLLAVAPACVIDTQYVLICLCAVCCVLFAGT